MLTLLQSIGHFTSVIEQMQNSNEVDRVAEQTQSLQCLCELAVHAPSSLSLPPAVTRPAGGGLGAEELSQRPWPVPSGSRLLRGPGLREGTRGQTVLLWPQAHAGAEG